MGGMCRTLSLPKIELQNQESLLLKQYFNLITVLQSSGSIPSYSLTDHVRSEVNNGNLDY